MKKKLMSILIACVISVMCAMPAFAASPNVAEDQSHSYALTIDGRTIELEEGDKVVIPLKLTDEGKALLEKTITPYGTYIDDAGTLTVWGKGTSFYWDVKMNIPALLFDGYVSAYNITHGTSCGRPPISGFSGSVVVSDAIGNVFGASLYGTAYMGAIPVAKTVDNWTMWNSNS